MRIFTPASELPMAGHPTIGSTFALAETGVIGPGAARFVFGLGVGPTPVDLEWENGRLRFAWMTQRTPTFGPALDARDLAARAVGLNVSDLSDQPVQEVSCGLPYVLVPLPSREMVDRATSDAAAIRRLAASARVAPAVYPFAVLPAGSEATVYTRMFAPDFGIGEDPATGSASGPLGCYLVRHRLVAAETAQRIINLQGVAMGRPSRMHVAIRERGAEIIEVKVGGTAVLVGRGELLV